MTTSVKFLKTFHMLSISIQQLQFPYIKEIQNNWKLVKYFNHHITMYPVTYNPVIYYQFTLFIILGEYRFILWFNRLIWGIISHHKVNDRNNSSDYHLDIRCIELPCLLEESQECRIVGIYGTFTIHPACVIPADTC